MTTDDVLAAADQLVQNHDRFAPLFGKEPDHAHTYLGLPPKPGPVDENLTTPSDFARLAFFQGGCPEFLACDRLAARISLVVGRGRIPRRIDRPGGFLMARTGRYWAIIGLILAAAGPGQAQEGSFGGRWRTSIGVVELKQDGDAVTGTYGNAGQFKIKGTVAGKVLTYEYQEGEAKGDARWTLNDSGLGFQGGYQIRGGRGGAWNGWRPDPEATKAARSADFNGTWLTSLGLMELKQDGAKVKGRFALRGGSEIEGDVTGRHLEFRFKAFGGGKGWFDLEGDGKVLAGAARDDGAFGWFGWEGRIAPEFAHLVPLQAGKVIDGATSNLLTYTVRAPEGYKAGGPKQWPAVVILHGSNMNGRSYVETIASAWPDIARDFLLIGINGERPSNTGPEPRFNFSYPNFVGKSTYKGFPGTDRESPALVSEALAELKGVYSVARYLVGGHSQGGFLTYSLLMNYPEQFAGAFPVSAGLIFQCEPSAYADESIRKAQRRVPLVIVHGKTDPVVSPGMGRYAAELFREQNWPAFRFLEPEAGGHMFALLPINEAIRWLDGFSAEDPAKALDFAEGRLKARAYRDVIAALALVKPNPVDAARVSKLEKAIDDLAAPECKDFVAKIRSGKPGWIDPFLAYRDEFEYAPAAKPAMTAFDELRAEQSPPAQTAYNEARALFQQGKADEAYRKYQEIVDRYPASPLYRIVKRSLVER